MFYHVKKFCAFIGLLVAIASLGGELNLTDKWSFAIDPQNKGEKANWYLSATKSKWKPIKIGFWEGQGIIYDGYAWYRNTFKLPAKAAKGGKVIIKFGAVDEDAKVWLNDKLIGLYAVGWNVPFSIDISSQVKYDTTNTLVVKVLDRQYCGGIWRPVKIQFQDKQKPFPVVQRLLKERVRAITAGTGNNHNSEIIKKHKLNLALSFSYILKNAGINKTSDKLVTEKTLPRLKALRNYAKYATANKLLTMPVIWFHTDTAAILQNRPYRRYVTFDGQICDVTPCPLDKVYWEKLMKPLFGMLAKIQLEENAKGGAAFDAEYYAGDMAGGFCYDPKIAHGCFCNHCFGGFLKFNNDNIDIRTIPVDERFEYVKNKYSSKPYLDYLENQIALQVGRVAEDTRKIKKDFLLGLLPDANNWFLRGVARGFSAPELPVLIFSESEYFTGFSEKSQQHINNLNKASFPYIYAGGLTISRYNAEGLGAKLAELAVKTDGYWLYYGETLFNPRTKIVAKNTSTSEYVLREPATRYWPAIKTANQWLDEHNNKTWLTGKNSVRTSLLTKKYFNILPQGIELTSKGFITTSQLPNTLLVKNADFAQALDKDWKTFSTMPERLKLPSGNYALLFDYSSKGTEKQFNSIFQIVPTQKGKKYQVSVDIKAEKLVNQYVGFQIYNSIAAGAIMSQIVIDAGSKWQNINKAFTAPADKVYLSLLANGAKGKVYFKNLQFKEMHNIKIKSTAINISRVNSIEAQFDDKQIDLFAMKPGTGLAYFKLIPGQCDSIWFLRKIFGSVPLKLELDTNIVSDTKNVPIKRLNVLLAQ
jgi:hypothetical protein